MKKFEIWISCLVLSVLTANLSYSHLFDFDRQIPNEKSQQFQEVLDKNFTGSIEFGISMAVHIDGLGTWDGVAGNAQVGELYRDENNRPVRDANGKLVRINTMPLTPDHRFHIGSLTKHFMSVLVLRLVEQGKMSLDDTLEKWAPDTQIPYADIMTVRQLLSHTAGVYNNTAVPTCFPMARADPKRPGTPLEVIDSILGYTPYFKPGVSGAWTYSNTGYTLIHMIVEAVTGDSVASQLHQSVLDPLELTNTYYGGFETYVDDGNRGYSSGDSPSSTQMHLSWAAGAGNITAAMRDVCRFDTAVFGGEFLQPDSLNIMLTPLYWSGSKTGYALGVEVETTDQSRNKVQNNFSWRGNFRICFYIFV